MLEACVHGPQRLRQLTVFPIVVREGPVLPYLHTKEALDSGVLTIREKTDGRVPVLLVRNRSLYATLILDGECLMAEGRERLAARPILLAGKSVTQIPATPPIEKPVGGAGEGLDIGESLQVFPASERQVGILAFLGKEFLGLEALGSPNLYAPVHNRFLARFFRKVESAGMAAEGCPVAEDSDAAELLRALEDAGRIKAKGIGLGEYWTLRGSVQGGELIHEGHLVRLSVTPAEGDPPLNTPFSEIR